MTKVLSTALNEIFSSKFSGRRSITRFPIRVTDETIDREKLLYLCYIVTYVLTYTTEGFCAQNAYVMKKDVTYGKVQCSEEQCSKAQRFVFSFEPLREKAGKHTVKDLASTCCSCFSFFYSSISETIDHAINYNFFICFFCR